MAITTYTGRFRPIPERVMDRFFARREVGALHVPRQRTACDLWTGALNASGAPQLCYSDGGQSYVLMGTTLALHAKGVDVTQRGVWGLHTCDARTCVNLDHILPGNPSENIRHRWIRGSAREQGVLRDEVLEQIVLRHALGHTRLPKWLVQQARVFGFFGVDGSAPAQAQAQAPTAVH